MRRKYVLWLAVVLFAAVLGGCFLVRVTSVGISGDGYTAYVPSDTNAVEEKLDQLLGSSEDEQNTAGRLNINTATEAELMTLPGIGETLAARIVRYRTYNGDFQKASHIKDVTGIGDALYEKIRDLIYVK